jgi:hypothetical protein
MTTATTMTVTRAIAIPTTMTKDNDGMTTTNGDDE